MRYTRGFSQLIIIGIIALVVIGGAGTVMYGQKKLSTKDSDSLPTVVTEKNAQILELERRLLELETAQGTKNTETEKSSKQSEEDALRLAQLQKEISALKKAEEDQRKQEAAKSTVATEVATKPATEQLKVTATLSIDEIIKKVEPLIVHIGGETTGSGFIISSDGLIVTNRHVVERDYVVTVTMAGKKEYSGIVVGRSNNYDLALVKIEKTGLTPLQFGSSDMVTLAQGATVYAFGYPFGYSEQTSFKTGVVARRITDKNQQYIETSTEIHPGNSGGPLIDSKGNVVGVITARVGYGDDSIKLALPINDLRPEIQTLQNSQKTFTAEQKKVGETYRVFLTEYNKVLTSHAELMDLLSKSLANTITYPATARKQMEESKKHFTTIKTQIPYIANKNNNAYPTDTSFSKNIEDTLFTFNRFISETSSLYVSLDRMISAVELKNATAFNEALSLEKASVDSISEINIDIAAKTALIYKQAGEYFYK